MTNNTPFGRRGATGQAGAGAEGSSGQGTRASSWGRGSPAEQPSAEPSAMSRSAGSANRAGSDQHGHPVEMIGAGVPEIDEVLIRATELGASDIMITADIPVRCKVAGRIISLGDEALTRQQAREMIYNLMSEDQKGRFEATGDLDFSMQMQGQRYRVNVYFQQGHVSSVMRLISNNIKTLADLKLPPVVSKLADAPRGLLLVTGPTGSGKSTTLAAIVNHINNDRDGHILTIEDPIEFVHESKRCTISHREVGRDTKSFASGLKSALRQAPDVILVGEMRDFETISAAITAAETGHLVMGTLHTNSAAETVDRIIDVFPEAQQSQVRVQLAKGLLAVLSQQLVRTKAEGGRAMAMEIMVANTSIRALIRDGKTAQLPSSIQTGASEGMISMDTALARLFKEGKITLEEGASKALSIEEYQRQCQAITGANKR